MNPFDQDDLFSVFGVSNNNNNPKKRTLEESIQLAEQQIQQRELKKIKQPSGHEDIESEDGSSNTPKLSRASSSKSITVDDIPTPTVIPNMDSSNDSTNDQTPTTADGNINNNDNNQTTTTNTSTTTTHKAIGKLGEKNDCLHEIALPPDYVISLDVDGKMIPPPASNEDVSSIQAHTKISEPQEIIHYLLEQQTQVELGLKPPAKTYPFTLDAFQRQAVRAIELSQSVLVSAHTSAGKTAVAEYAIAKSLKDGSRVIYTSPIKALSNQKFRELQEEFTDVGLMTGDVTINPNSSCIVMTTEILRSMLYRGSEILNEVQWVIFDEVHYMRDKERGVVWEETLILLPNSVKYVFLSATIPNATEFAGWIAKLKGQPVHVVYTDYRPTPLQHYIYPVGGEGIHLVVEKHSFKEENWKKAIEDLTNASSQLNNSSGSSKRGGSSNGASGTERKKRVDTSLVKLVNMIMKRNFQPVIVFSFSRKECESRAVSLSKSNFNDEEEMSLVAEVFNNAIDSLNDEDKKLPQVESMLPLLQKGIGVHHSGLLPIMKEVIEILFQEGLIKVLFATETFAMGLNMPAKTVLFTGIEKFDGQITRRLTSGEYIQMSGRAGRRGLDDKGIVILILDDPEMREEDARQLMNGIADCLNSSFHLSYYMVLNLLRVEEISPEYIMERSFYQYQSEKKRASYEQKLKELEQQRNELAIENEAQISSYYSLKNDLQTYYESLRQLITTPSYSISVLSAGRLLRINGWGWGILLKFTKKKHAERLQVAQTKASDYNIEVLIPAHPQSDQLPYPIQEYQTNASGLEPKPVIKTFSLASVEVFSSVKVYLSKELKTRQTDATSSECKSSILKLLETIKRFKAQTVVETSDGTMQIDKLSTIKYGDLPRLDLIEEMGIPKNKVKEIVDAIQQIESRLSYSPFYQEELSNYKNSGSSSQQSKTVSPLFAQVKLYEQKLELDAQIDEMKKLIKTTAQVVMKEELKKMMRVLRRLGFATEDNVITAKGRVACELSSADSLVITEMVYNGAFSDLTPEQSIAVLSCFASEVSGGQSREDDKATLAEDLRKPYEDLEKAARRVAEVSVESKLDLDVEKYLQSFPCNMMNLTYAWCNGAQFVEICKMTEMFEGSIVRSMRRCEEIVRQMCAAAKAIGEESLEKKLLLGLEKMRRDIVFSSSLYL
ncbi:hypothetical protein FDP41_011049 [Naegleria fowleri]|uniref:RNA helicase n=1 Tax=Naegleria fowleri TaxID=5763 RepID=A0A6A5C7G8_NAEFO|nr:uncharacterized protein FDP41_011049 [Naegleria fowleri]KAF0983071.1 hypothetical protein FDP41_011049 [Naegleria fowleri]CAG4712380.1 unnamed protein product [Naegleria fowleri]